MRKPKLPNKHQCTGCMACHDACRMSCINFKLGSDGHFVRAINTDKCISCHKCEKSCPALKAQKGLSTESTPWATWCNNDGLRNLSSSGGTFAAIAQKFIQDGGIVIGAAISGTNVGHIAVSDTADLYQLQGSKYIQSDTRNIYKYALKQLADGKKVLFSGTGCQVAAIYNFIPKKLWTNLYTIDLICHGVPSRLDLGLFLKNQPKKVIEIKSFRDKSWKFGYAMTCIADDGSILRSDDNYFYAAFNNNKTLRWSCYKCPFKTGLERRSDITIGDYWGAKGFEEQTTKGVSLTITHNSKGESLLRAANLEIHRTRWEEAILHNKDYYLPLNLYKFNPLRWLYPIAVSSFSYSTMRKIYGSQDISSFLYFPLRAVEAVFQHYNYQYSIKSYKKILCKIQEKQ